MPQRIILVVEDDESILFNLKLFLKMNNYEVITAVNGLQALNVLQNCSKLPSLILSDIMMPEMNGFDLLKKLQKNNNWDHIPLIFISADSSPESIKFGISLGAIAYLTKPINQNILLTNLKKIFNI